MVYDQDQKCPVSASAIRQLAEADGGGASLFLFYLAGRES
jgi:hypothetical protein